MPNLSTIGLTLFERWPYLYRAGQTLVMVSACVKCYYICREVYTNFEVYCSYRDDFIAILYITLYEKRSNLWAFKSIQFKLDKCSTTRCSTSDRNPTKIRRLQRKVSLWVLKGSGVFDGWFIRVSVFQGCWPALIPVIFLLQVLLQSALNVCICLVR